jgi:hypothetical protein
MKGNMTLSEPPADPADGRRSGAHVAVRLEGGVGDHILGMRALYFIRKRFPDHQVVVYSDCAGAEPQLSVAAMSPFVASVVPIRQKAGVIWESMGRLENVVDEDLNVMRSSDLFMDLCGSNMLIPTAIALRVPIMRLLSHRPAFNVPERYKQEGDALVRSYPRASVFVAMNLTKYGPTILREHLDTFSAVVEQCLSDPDVIILNLLTTRFGFEHWPEPRRSERQRLAEEEAEIVRSLASLSERVVNCVDLRIETVAALLYRCSYFIGVDNGIKHLAWAIGVPRTFFVVGDVHPMRVFRWIPDIHRMLPFGIAKEVVLSQVAHATRLWHGRRDRLSGPVKMSVSRIMTTDGANEEDVIHRGAAGHDAARGR